MPLRLVKNPDSLVNSIVDDLEVHLHKLSNIYNDQERKVSKDDLHEVKALAEKYSDEIEIKFSESLPEHLDERTELKDLLVTITSLEHVIKQLLPGRIKYIIKQLDEIKLKNNSEILKFFNE